jgi:iron-sulfur cluster assembly protein
MSQPLRSAASSNSAFRGLAATTRSTSLRGNLSFTARSIPRCPQCLKALPVSASRHNSSSSSKRLLQTATAYKPYSLPPQQPTPPLARNDGVPGVEMPARDLRRTKTKQEDRSVAASSREPQPTASSPLTPPQPRPSQPQPQSQPTTSTTPTTTQAPAPAPTTRPTSKLRPLKAAVHLTPSAIQELRRLITSDDPKLIRIGVKNRGCSGLAYNLEYVDAPGRFDEEVVQEGVRVLVDSRSLMSIIGSEMDWVEDRLSRRFVFRNPNITEQCGCGESFSVS